MRRIFSGLVLMMILTGSLTLAFNIQPVGAESKTWYVDGPADFSKIQDAINVANDGDAIFVLNGTYYENVVVNKTVSLVGESNVSTIVDGLGTGIVFDVTADNVSLTGFTIQKADWCGIQLQTENNNVTDSIIIDNYPWDGIFLRSSCNNTISGNTMTNNGLGLEVLFWSAGNNISRNRISNNWYDIEIGWSGNNVLKDNILSGSRYSFGIEGDSLSDFLNDIDTSNTIDGKPIYYMVNQKDVTVDPTTFPEVGYLGFVNSTGIKVEGMSFTKNNDAVLLAYTSNSTVENINALDNQYGVKLLHSNTVTVRNNTITKASFGVYLGWSSNNNTVSGNQMYLSNIFLYESEQNIVVGNTVDGLNLYLAGVVLQSSRNNIMAQNAVANRTAEGIVLSDSTDNIITENDIENNECGVGTSMSSNDFLYHNNFINNVQQAFSIESVNRWNDNYPSGGNYWSDYNGTDSNRDGMGDTPYVIDANNTHNYPLMHLWMQLVGDVNGDGKVSLADLILLASAYNSKAGDSNWNPMADLAAPYRIISLTDLVTMAIHYGQQI